QERTIFYFYAVVLVPFLCLALAMALGAALVRAAVGGPGRWGGSGLRSVASLAGVGASTTPSWHPPPWCPARMAG
ncbi:hypothetical protein, partial [Streptomyces bohaiensis]